MAFLNNSTNNIVIDAVLTDVGRQKLAQGNFSVFSFGFGDDEVDYSTIEKYGVTTGKEKIEKNTPVFEALTNTNLSLKHMLTSVSNPNQVYMPLFTVGGLTGGILTLAEGNASTGVAVNIAMSSAIGGSVPAELVDNIIVVYINRLFLAIDGYTPVNSQALANNPTLNTARYEIPATTSSTPIVFRARSLPQAVFDTYSSFSGGAYINTYVRIMGRNSGLSSEFQVKITAN
jgi:hypothetical protein